MLLGRDHEQRVIKGLVQNGGALVLVGDPGIGKSTLIAAARRFAIEQDMKVLAATGVPAESHLPYAGLHQLLRPLREDIGDLPGPQRGAIDSAFGKDTDHVPDRFLVAIAVTDLLTMAAGCQPLLVLADDTHWLDPPSCEVLAFLGRRVDGEPITLLCTARDGYQLPLLEAGLEELRLGGLSEEAAGQLLDAVAPGLGAAARREILDASLGNPLALSELSGCADPGPLTIRGGAAVTYRIEKAFGARWSELPEDTRTVVLVAALNEGGTLSETLEASARVAGSPLTTETVAPAIAARLVDAGPGWLRFRHPLVRSAIEYRAGLDKNTAAHQALAAVLAGQSDRRAWHRAAAALGPDENVAAELDEAASRAERRAALSVAVTALERAVELSLDPAARNSRLLRAAQLAWQLGRPALVDRLAQSVEGAALDLPDRARLALLQESIETGLSEGAGRIRYLTELARQAAAGGQPGLAMELLVGAARRCWWADPGRHLRLLVAEAALELAGDPLNPALQSALAFAAPDLHGTTVRANLTVLSRDASLDAVQLTHLGLAAMVLGAFDQARTLLGAAIPQLRRQGRLGLLVRVLNYDASSAAYSARWADAIAASEESERVAAETGQRRWVAKSQVAKALGTAPLGLDAETERITAEAEQFLLPAGISSSLAQLQAARGLAALGRRDYQEAYEHLVRIFDPADTSYNHLLRMYHIGDLADAARHSGHREQARELIEKITASTTGKPAPVVAVSLAFAAAMLADDEAAGQTFQQVLTQELRSWPFHYARLKLEYGGWLRRHRQPARSREHLRTARDILDALGARAWRDRADAELRASGETRRVAGTGRLDQLTAQERQIARMVQDGLSNREIGERLLMSHRTVGSHLYRMFPKLGITSRAELAAMLAKAGALGAD
ncbi:MAG: AAA family ATPase [Streptosporangiaceae bacterium]